MLLISRNRKSIMALKRCHFIGIGGIGMSGLAKILVENQCAVSGSDLSSNERIKHLKEAGASVFLEHSAINVPLDASVVYNSMVNEKNIEFQFAKENSLPLLHRSDLLKLLMQGHQSLLVSGSHGKTTTSSLLSWVLEYAGLDPTYAIGGVLLNTQSNARKGKGAYFVAEADESDGTFTKYQGFGAIVTNISHEHMDFYKEETALLENFELFCHNIVNKNLLFWCGEDQRLKKMNSPGISYGFDEACLLRGENFRQHESSIAFDVHFAEQKYSNVSLPLIGRHNALNALAVFGLCLSLKIPQETIKAAFSLFKGVSRRMEKKGESKGVLVIDDYAHHPNEIKTTLETLRRSFPWRRIVALYQPHRYSRTLHCKGSFGPIFDAVDLALVTDIYSAYETPIPGLSALTVIEEIRAVGNVPCRYIQKEQIVPDIVKELQPLDIVVLLGAGDITYFSQSILESIEKYLPKLKLGIIFGGRSSEHEISVLSAKNVHLGIDPSFFAARYFAIDKEGHWLNSEQSFKALQEGKIEDAKQDPTWDQEDVFRELLECDLVFPVMHGPFGEDGKLQGFLETLDLACIGCSSKPSALCMDKGLLKKVAHFHAIPILPFVELSDYRWRYDKEAILKEVKQRLRFPLFVKPAHLGSSIGIVKVEEECDLEDGVDAALKYDTKIIIENGIEGREIEFALMGCDAVQAFAPGEILTHGKVYHFEGKYGESAMIAEASADLSPELKNIGLDLAKRAYNMACCDGFARVDFFLDHHGNFYLNEINPIPGFTAKSMYPKICEKSGMNYFQIINTLASIGLYKKRKSLKKRNA
ncbi:Bifunctional enzyme MurC/Ddl [Chlamydiales bacterium STE3]|nr:Bifunctional enzyme MurC/Ddl [Chlamydiales bacterium STE3]